ncbi:MAG: STAS domain-containing protein [Desulfuromonadaceae bacterium]|nr:STAS domain-containing protein [Desulfuromonadaceae bacterium]
MEIKLEMDNEVVILKLSGNLVAGTAEELKEQIAKLIEKKYLFILLDMGKIDFMDSSGLGACIAIKRDLVANVGLLACTGLNENVRKVFRMTRADQKIMIFDARQDAVGALLERIHGGRK